MKTVYVLRGDNKIVTDFYIDIVAKSFNLLGYSTIDVAYGKKSYDTHKWIIVPSALDLLKWYIKGFRQFVLWSQGTMPEESYMRKHSKVKWLILSLIERWGLKKATVNLFVSETQKQYFENLYHLNLSHNSYIMPCYNCKLSEESFKYPLKYKKNIFAYTGSFKSPWQYIDGNLSFYKKIENKYGDKVFLKILTPHKDEALNKIKEFNIINYSIDCVKPEDLPLALADAKFGLLLRENNIVNNIATPTKLSTYMSCGLIPIVSSCIKDYDKNMKGKPFFVLVNDELTSEKVDELLYYDVSGKDVYNSFIKYWEEFYNTSVHVHNIASIIKSKL